MLLEISTTIGCPMDCSYCPQDLIKSRYRGPRLMSVETFTQAMENCPRAMPISFAGYAEPYLNKNTSKMIGIAYSRFSPIQVYTTGVGLTDDDAAMLARIQPSNFVFHIPDGDGDMKAGKIDTAFVLRMLWLKQSLANFKAVVFGSIHPLLRCGDWNIQGYGKISRAGNVVTLPQVKVKGPVRCRPDPKIENNVLIPDGTLHACCCDYGLDHPLGNLTEETWDEIHASDAHRRFMSLQELGDNPMCRHCEYAEPLP